MDQPISPSTSISISIWIATFWNVWDSGYHIHMKRMDRLMTRPRITKDGMSTHDKLYQLRRQKQYQSNQTSDYVNKLKTCIVITKEEAQYHLQIINSCFNECHDAVINLTSARQGKRHHFNSSYHNQTFIHTYLKRIMISKNHIHFEGRYASASALQRPQRTKKPTLTVFGRETTLSLVIQPQKADVLVELSNDGQRASPLKFPLDHTDVLVQFGRKQTVPPLMFPSDDSPTSLQSSSIP
jgi:hypothetical protein